MQVTPTLAVSALVTAGDRDDDGDNVPDEEEDDDSDGVSNEGHLVTLVSVCSMSLSPLFR